MRRESGWREVLVGLRDVVVWDEGHRVWRMLRRRHRRLPL